MGKYHFIIFVSGRLDDNFQVLQVDRNQQQQRLRNSRYYITNLDAPWDWNPGRFTYMKSINLSHSCIGLIFHTWSIRETYISITKLCKPLNYCSCVCARSIHIPCLYIIYVLVRIYCYGQHLLGQTSIWRTPQKKHVTGLWWVPPSLEGSQQVGGNLHRKSQRTTLTHTHSTRFKRNYVQFNILVYWQVGLIDVLRIFLKSRPLPIFHDFSGSNPIRKEYKWIGVKAPTWIPKLNGGRGWPVKQQTSANVVIKCVFSSCGKWRCANFQRKTHPVTEIIQVRGLFRSVQLVELLDPFGGNRSCGWSG